MNDYKAQLLFERGIQKSMDEAYAEAIELLSEAIALDNTKGTYYLNRGIAYDELKQTAKAKADYERLPPVSTALSD